MKESDRMTHKRVNGIKTGFWSAASKENLVQRLAAYENLGLSPDEMRDFIDSAHEFLGFRRPEVSE